MLLLFCFWFACLFVCLFSFLNHYTWFPISVTFLIILPHHLHTPLILDFTYSYACKPDISPFVRYILFCGGGIFWIIRQKQISRFCMKGSSLPHFFTESREISVFNRFLPSGNQVGGVRVIRVVILWRFHKEVRFFCFCLFAS